MKLAVVIPNWNGEEHLRKAVDSILKQSIECTLVVVDNGSKDLSRHILESYHNRLVTIYNDKNYGFTGGVNKGMEWALDNNYDGVALFNNDAVADKDWLKNLSIELRNNIGIVTSLILSHDGRTIDTTGDQMTVWGLPYPRGRKHTLKGSPYDKKELVFGASGGASLYSCKMLSKIGLFDQDFFAYYEDVDISFRAQLAGWNVLFQPKAKVYHHIGATSSKIKGFTSYHTFKNLPILVVKNTPKSLKRITYPRFYLAYSTFQLKALLSRNAWPMIKGSLTSIWLIPKKLRERKQIMQNMKVTDEYILSIMTHDLPENSAKLRKLRTIWWKLTGRKS